MKSVDFTGLQSIDSIRRVKAKKKKMKVSDVTKRGSFMKFKNSLPDIKKKSLSRSRSYHARNLSKNKCLLANKLNKDRSKVLRVSIQKA